MHTILLVEMHMEIYSARRFAHSIHLLFRTCDLYTRLIMSWRWIIVRLIAFMAGPVLSRCTPGVSAKLFNVVESIWCGSRSMCQECMAVPAVIAFRLRKACYLWCSLFDGVDLAFVVAGPRVRVLGLRLRLGADNDSVLEVSD